jgi:hypothetical protein
MFTIIFFFDFRLMSNHIFSIFLNIESNKKEYLVPYQILKKSISVDFR